MELSKARAIGTPLPIPKQEGRTPTESQSPTDNLHVLAMLRYPSLQRSPLLPLCMLPPSMTPQFGLKPLSIITEARLTKALI